MSLDFLITGTDVVNHRSGPSLDDLGTVTRVFWVKSDVLAANDSLFGKLQGAANSRFAIRDTSGNLRLTFSTSAGFVNYFTSSLALTTGEWYCVAYTFDEGGGVGSRTHIYIGDLTTAMAEPTYSTSDDDGGTYTADAAANYHVGNNGNIANCFDGKIAMHGCWNRVMSLFELNRIAIDSRTLKPLSPQTKRGLVLWTHYGHNGIGNQEDESQYGNYGIVTGATIAEPIPTLSTRRFIAPYAVTINPPQTVSVNTLTLVSSAENLSVTPGAVSVSTNTLTLASNTEALSVVPGAASVPVNTLTLDSSAETLSVVPGSVSVTMNALTLAGSAESLSVIPGAVSVVTNALTLTGTAESLTVVPGAVSVVTSTLTLISTSETLSVTPGPVSITINTLTLVSSVESLTVLAGEIVTLNTLTLSSSVESLSVVPGPVLVSANTLTLASAAENLSVIPGSVSVSTNTLTLVSSSESLSVVPGAVSVSISTLTLVSTVESLSILVTGAQTVVLQTLVISVSTPNLIFGALVIVAFDLNIKRQVDFNLNVTRTVSFDAEVG